MEKVAEYFSRLKKASAYTIERDGRTWYDAWKICNALQANYSDILKYVRKEDKITLRRVSLIGFENKTYITREGVEAAIMLRGGLPRKRMLEALA